MTTSTATASSRPAVPNESAPKSRKISWTEFQAKYLAREDAYKYEWLQGVVEKTKRSMDQSQFYILQNLLRFFRQVFSGVDVPGELISEGDLFFQGNHRRPDIAYLSARQIAAAAAGKQPVPEFIIEIISTNDQINRVHGKMRDYENAGVKIVWHIFPALDTVHVYAGDHLESMTVCRGNDVCSAEPVLPGFALPVQEILKKPM